MNARKSYELNRRCRLVTWLLCLMALFQVHAYAMEPDDSTLQVVVPAQSPVFLVEPVFGMPVQEHEVKAGLLYDAANGKIVWQKNMNNVLPIASLTKMMVALLAVEDVKAGKFQWTDNVHWTRESWVGRRSKRRKVYSEANYTLRDVFKAAMIASNNECSEQMARFLGNGDLAATISRMNQRARELGMNSTYYGNPTGLPASSASLDNSSSPVDQLVLGLELLKYEEVLEITGMGYAQVNNGRASSVIRNHNGLAIQYTGVVDGLKTGYTRRAGFCLVGTTAKCDHRLISVVLGCRGPQIRNEVVRDMFNAYYTSIGLDPLGPYCPAPYSVTASSVGADSVVYGKGEWITIREKVKKYHTVRSGETLSGIAGKYKCSTTQIRSWNKGRIASSGMIRTGQKLAIQTTTSRKVWISQPANGDEESDDKPLIENATASTGDDVKKDHAATLAVGGTSKGAHQTATAPEAAKPKSDYVYHVVAPGDTLYSIARKYEGASVEQLKDLNNIRDSRSLKPGTKLKVKVTG